MSRLLKELFISIFITAFVIFIIIPGLVIFAMWSIETFGIFGFGVWLSIIIGGGLWGINITDWE